MEETSSAVEAALMEELREALEEQQQQLPPTISIPKTLGVFPSNKSVQSVQKQTDSSFGQTASVSIETASMDEDELVVNRVVSASSSSARVEMESHEYHDDSFVVTLSNVSIGSSSDDSSTEDSQDCSHDSRKFYIGTVEEEASVVSRVSNLDAENMTPDELMAVVRSLYESVKEADEALYTERERRKSRESSLIKLAKELTLRKDEFRRQASQNDELREELRMVRSEKSLLLQRLEHEVKYKHEEVGHKEETIGGLKKSLAELQSRYDKERKENEERIMEMNKTHALQCEQLCREVVQANEEASSLKTKLVRATQSPYKSDASVSAFEISDRPAPKKKKRKSRRRLMKWVFLACVFGLISYFEFNWSGVSSNVMSSVQELDIPSLQSISFASMEIDLRNKLSVFTSSLSSESSTDHEADAADAATLSDIDLGETGIESDLPSSDAEPILAQSEVELLNTQIEKVDLQTSTRDIDHDEKISTPQVEEDRVLTTESTDRAPADTSQPDVQPQDEEIQKQSLRGKQKLGKNPIGNWFQHRVTSMRKLFKKDLS